MSPAERPNSKALVFLACVPWVLGLTAATNLWSFVVNVIDHDWILASGRALSTLAVVALIILFVWLRRRADRNVRAPTLQSRTVKD